MQEGTLFTCMRSFLVGIETTFWYESVSMSLLCVHVRKAKALV